jgi:hypothetical protein
MSYTAFLSIIIFCSFINSFSHEVITLEDSIPERIFSLQSLSYYEDVENMLTIKEVSKDSFQSRFLKNPLYSNKDYNTDATYWIKFSIRQNASSDKLWLLEFYDQTSMKL